MKGELSSTGSAGEMNLRWQNGEANWQARWASLELELELELVHKHTLEIAESNTQVAARRKLWFPLGSDR